MNQLTEVLVLGEENASFPKCKADDRLVVGPRRQFSDRQDLVSHSSQRTDDGVVATLVGEKPHQR